MAIPFPTVTAPAFARDDCSTTILLQPAWDRFQREARHGTLDTGRYRMPYFVWGEGPPVVFVHGLCDDAASLVLPLARLSRRFCCIAYDQDRKSVV